MSKIALVTVLFNSDNVLDGFFKSLSIQNFKDYHLYIVDNTPNPTTDALIENLSIKYSLTCYSHLKNDKNEGVAKGNNQGILFSLKEGFEYTLLLNNDIEFYQEDLIKSMYNYATNNHETLLIPKIVYFDSGKIWMAGGIIQHYKGTNIHVGDSEEDSSKFDKVKYFNYAPTCFMLIKNSIFASIGLMDEKYFVYYDDFDFIYRAGKMGEKVCYLPFIKIHHKVSSSTGGPESAFSIYYSNRNRIYFLRKNYSGVSFAIPIIVTFTTRIIKYLFYNKNNRQKLIEGIRDGLKM